MINIKGTWCVFMSDLGDHEAGELHFADGKILGFGGSGSYVAEGSMIAGNFACDDMPDSPSRLTLEAVGDGWTGDLVDNAQDNLPPVMVTLLR
ncbi:MAG: hypothetical protein ABL931_00330 [Usitatibacteraceae bacterium]